MKSKPILTLALSTLLLGAGCASAQGLVETFQGLGIGDTLPETLPRLLEAIPDIAQAAKARGIRGLAEDTTCDLYGQRVRGLAEGAWTHDWPVIKEVFTRPVTTPQDDEEFCRAGIEALGANIFTKGEGGHGGTSLFFAVGLPPDFEKRSPVLRAALTCHEWTHMVWMHRVGIAMASFDYATVSGRIATEAVAYAIGDGMETRHGVPEAKVLRRRKRRTDRFPTKYELDKAVSSECVRTIFRNVREVLRERAGV